MSGCDSGTGGDVDDGVGTNVLCNPVLNKISFL